MFPLHELHNVAQIIPMDIQVFLRPGKRETAG